MSAYSIPSFTMVVVTIYVGFYHLYLYFRRNFKHREDLAFAICCITMALYGVYCVGMYNAHSLSEGVQFQRGQVAVLTFIGTTFLCFVVEYLNIKQKWIRNILTLFFIISTVIILSNRTNFTFYMDQPSIKKILMPLGKQVIYYEVKPGPFIEVLSLMGMMVFVYAFIMAVKEYRYRDKRKAKSMIGAIIIFFIALLNDVSVHFGFYNSLYVIEYGYMAIVILMAVSLSNEVVESAIRKEALEESEKKYRELVDNSLVGIFIVQDDRIHFCNQRFSEIFGYQQANEVSGQSWSQFIAAKDRDFILSQMLAP